MRTRTLTQEEALALCNSDGFTINHSMVINGNRRPIAQGDRCVSFALESGPSAYSQAFMYGLIELGATIEVTEQDIFDNPAFEKWDVNADRDWAKRAGFIIWSRGIVDYAQSFVRHVNPSDIPALAEAVNRLVEVGEVSE
jgi:hypothetical protein